MAGVRGKASVPDVIDDAAKGEPQHVRRDGLEVVVVSRAYVQQTLPTLKIYALTSGVSAGAMAPSTGR